MDLMNTQLYDDLLGTMHYKVALISLFARAQLKIFRQNFQTISHSNALAIRKCDNLNYKFQMFLDVVKSGERD